MSTECILRDLVAAGRLYQFIPVSFFGEQPQRGLFIPPELHDLLNKEPEGIDEKERIAFIHARLARFVNGEFVDNYYYMKRLHGTPKDIWEILIKDMVPAYRIFGMFALPDTFICSHIKPRATLGRYKDPNWKEAMMTASNFWENLFPNIPRFTAQDFTSYVTTDGGHYDWNYKE